MYDLFLLLHILGAIVAFGPTFAVAVLGARVQKAPENAAFVTDSIIAIAKVLITPFALSMFVTGVVLMFVADYTGSEPWLATSIGLYVVAVAISFGVQMPTTKKLSAMLRGEQVAADPMKLVKTSRMTGMLQTLLFIAILSLMVFKPGA